MTASPTGAGSAAETPDDYPALTWDKLRYADTDRQGHVNNAVFATFLETGRVEILRDPDRPVGGPDTEWVIARVELDLLAEVTWPGRVRIGTGVVSLGRSSVRLRQGLFHDGRLVARAETVLVQTGLDPTDGVRRGVPLGEADRARLEELRISS